MYLKLFTLFVCAVIGLSQEQFVKKVFIPRLNASYVGCFQDTTSKSKRVPLNMDYYYMTVPMCIHFCRKNYERYAVLQDRIYCYCTSPASMDIGVCNSPCAGNRNEICGGKSSVSFYMLS
ncbi:unnamed protein product [Brachionus calyciflorus]|uniref:WSC domain-containing protein n=1 Tax=Brachionus calyciflorus TaxID=104777 RepID=A0A813M2D2_9BILA|nr:unnamed protein product [Brachionus calyciflorus]